MPHASDIAGLEQTFTALADPARLAVIALLREQPLRSGEIASRLSLSRPSMSKHLQVLRKAGLVEERAQGDDARARMYQLRPAPFAELRGWLDEVEAFWTDQLGAFKRYAEARAGQSAGVAARGRGRRTASPARRRERRRA